MPPPRLGPALLTTVAATVAPGSGHLLLGRRRTGGLILGAFLLGLLGVLGTALLAPRSEVLERLLSTRVLAVAGLTLLVAGAAWLAVIVRTYALARPDGLRTGQRVLGAAVVAALCMLVAAPLSFGANLANSQRNLLDTLFPGGGPATLSQPRINILLVGSDAGPDRTGARTDTMMVASIDTRTSRTVLFGLPRNLAYAPFPPGSRMDEEFPDGFDGSGDSGEYLLNALYAYGLEFPELAPDGPTRDQGMNLLQSSVSTMLGLPIDYYLEVNMAGFASIIDAVGGVKVDVGPERLPLGGITPSGREVEPDGYLPAGVQQLDGEAALSYARSRVGSTDYARMGRQRCLVQSVLDQKSPIDLLTNFQALATATTNSVSSNIPQQVLPALVNLAGDMGSVPLESVSFDPNLADPDESDGRFNPGDPDFDYVREVVQEAITRGPAQAPRPTVAPPTSAPPAAGLDGQQDRTDGVPPTTTPPPTSAPALVAGSC